MTKPYQIYVTGTANYFPHLIVLIKSFVAFHRHSMTFIIGHNIKDPNDPAILEVKETFKDYPNVQLDFHYIDPQLFIDWGVVPDVAKEAVLLRLALPTLPYNGRVLYIDIDTLVTGPLDELFTDENIFQGKSIAVCADLTDYFDKFSPKGFYRQEKFPSKFYTLPFGEKGNVFFNAGVMLIDLEKIRISPDKDKNLWQYHCAEIFNEGRFAGLDQTFLNIVHFYDKTIISNKYNFFVFLLNETRHVLDIAGWKNYPQSLAEGKVEAPMYPSVIHFLTLSPKKQWDSYLIDHQDLYNFYKEQSVEQIIDEDVDYYFQMMINYYDHYGYTPGLIDFGKYDKYLYNYSVEQVSKAVGLFSKPWSFSPLLLSTTIYKLRGLRKLLNRYRLNHRGNIKGAIKHSNKVFVPFKDLAKRTKK
ncbi:hypothetical protein CJP74_00470 [Psittacicella melopsittaci]|uniref:Glycosyltransferase family 8 protein n=1 Tax=Psittacicella melopsittaci TaxID=2028576 RepID=A0A3A1Y8Q7_9GAMM|nr:glycosyltransferase [Psittacicella melopsittaci]RIY33931.1 hypothetical protein CJP74_00470 [Psittacicella melopsittaci]